MYCPQLLFMLLCSLPVKCQSIDDFTPPKPAYPRLFNDEAAYAYYHTDWRRIEDKLINHHRKTGNQLVIITIPSLHGYSVQEMAIHTFRNWGIGDQQQNTGLLILISRKEKKLSIETGYGLEGQVTDIAAASIIHNILGPALLKHDFQLLPARQDKGYLPAIYKAIDTLTLLTNKVNTQAVQNLATHQKRSKAKTIFTIIPYILIAVLTALALVRASAGMRHNKPFNIQNEQEK